jgi:hypothetical protein
VTAEISIKPGLPAESNTHWTAIREQREDRDLSAPDETGPARLLALLAEAGVQAYEKDGLVLLNSDATSPATLVAFVSASELFTRDAKLEQFLERRGVGRLSGTPDFFTKKLWLWLEDHDNLSGPHAYLFVVDMDNWLADPLNRDVAHLVEHDVAGVRKIVTRAAELPARLANPFGPACAGVRLPKFEVQRMDPHPFETPPRDFDATVTHLFNQAFEPYDWLEKLFAHPEAARLLPLAQSLVRRVMGAPFELMQDCDTVTLHRNGRSTPLPWYCLSYSEQHGLAFCAYLTQVSADASPKMWLGITDVLGCLDLSHYLLAMDVVRDLIIATRINVYLKTNKSDQQNLARLKFEAAINHLKRTNA